MNHRIKKRTFGLEKAQREALMASLAEALIINKRIQTTEAKAKSLRPFIEKIITIARNDTVQNRRIINSRLKNRDKSVAVLFKDIAPKFINQTGGYTRILKLPPRESDASPRALIEFVK